MDTQPQQSESERTRDRQTERASGPGLIQCAVEGELLVVNPPVSLPVRYSMPSTDTARGNRSGCGLRAESSWVNFPAVALRAVRLQC